MKKIFSLIIAAALLFMSCLADENSVSVEVDNSNVYIEGSGAEENAYVTLQVFLRTNTSKLLESMTYPDYTDVLVCHDQTRADADGNYSFSFDIDNDTAEYTAYINTGSSDDVISKTFSFVNMKQFESVANALNTSTSASEISKLISDNKEVFDLTETEIKSMDLSAFSTIILNYTQSGNAFSNTDRTSVIRIIDKIYYIQQLNESKIDDLYTETEVNGLDTSDISKLYELAFITNDLKKSFTTRMSKRGFTSIKQYEDFLSEAFMLAVVENPNGYENIITVAKELKDILDIPEKYITDSNCSRIAGEDYDDIDELIDALKPDDGGSQSKPGTSTKKPVVSSVTMPAVYDDTNDKISADIFDDLDGFEWARESIVKLAELGVVSGKEKYKFYPEDYLTREEFVKMLVIALKLPETNEKISFTDADPQMWYYPYLERAVASSVVSGKSDLSFGIGEKITRQDMAVMTYNALLATGNTVEPDGDFVFDDDYLIAEYAKNAVYGLKGKEIINGMGNGCYQPTDYSNRAAAAKIIYSLIAG